MGFRLLSLLIMLVLIGCTTNQEKGIELPEANYYSESLSKSVIDLVIKQIDSNHIELSSNEAWRCDTFHIDSSYYQSIYEFLEPNIYRHGTLVELDKSLPIQHFKKLKNQFRKGQGQRITFSTINGGIKMKLQPYDPYYESKGENKHLPPYPPYSPFIFDKDSLAAIQVVVKIEVKPNKLICTDWLTKDEVNMKDYLLDYQNARVFYIIDSNCVYQDFINVIDTVFGLRNLARKKALGVDSTCTNRELSRLYPIRMLDLDLPY